MGGWGVVGLPGSMGGGGGRAEGNALTSREPSAWRGAGGRVNAERWACRFYSLLYMLERTHTMQIAGSTVAIMAIVQVCVCVCARDREKESTVHVSIQIRLIYWYFINSYFQSI